MIAWRWNVLKRVQGEVIKTPDPNYFLPVSDSSDAAWEETKKLMMASEQALLNFFEHAADKEYDKIYPVSNMSYRDLIHGIIQHDAYHLGQVVMLSKH